MIVFIQMGHLHLLGAASHVPPSAASQIITTSTELETELSNFYHWLTMNTNNPH